MWTRQNVFAQLMDTLIAHAAAQGQVDLSLVSVDSTVARAHHHAAGMVLAPDLLDDLTKAVAAEKGLQQRDKPPRETSDGATETDPAGPGRRTLRRRQQGLG
jgi:hypothetical protein